MKSCARMSAGHDFPGHDFPAGIPQLLGSLA